MPWSLENKMLKSLRPKAGRREHGWLLRTNMKGCRFLFLCAPPRPPATSIFLHHRLQLHLAMEARWSLAIWSLNGTRSMQKQTRKRKLTNHNNTPEYTRKFFVCIPVARAWFHYLVHRGKHRENTIHLPIHEYKLKISKRQYAISTTLETYHKFLPTKL